MSDLEKIRLIRYWFPLKILSFFFNSPANFVYFLKSLGYSDGFCFRALECIFKIEYAEAKKIFGVLIGTPFVDDKLGYYYKKMQ